MMSMKGNKKYLFILILFSLGLGVALNSKTNTTAVEEYIQNSNSTQKLSLDDYKSVGITSVNKENIQEVNKAIYAFKRGKVDFNTVGVYYGRHYPTYRYDSTLDYLYNFKQSKASIIPITIKSGNFVFNKSIDTNNSSVFLKVKIQSNIIGKYFLPILTIDINEKKSLHTFEYGAKGIRYINMSNLQLSKKGTVLLKGKFLTIADQKAELILFKNVDLNNKKILIISPHPDDAEIAAFGLYSTYKNQTYIATITAGDAGPDTVYHLIYKNRQKLYKEKGIHRVWDSISIPALGGVPYEHSINLGFFDGRLAQMYNQKDKNFSQLYTNNYDTTIFRKYNHSPLSKELVGASNWNSLVESLVNILSKIKPDIIVTPYPRLDKHPDHKYSSVAIFEAIKKANIHSGKLFLYSNHPTMSEYFPFGKRGEPVDLPPFFNKLYFDKIYSFQLTKLLQKRKIFALEAMSDLRYESESNPFIPQCKDKNPLTCRDFSYFRRAVRENELFFVVDIEKLYNKELADTLYH